MLEFARLPLDERLPFFQEVAMKDYERLQGLMTKSAAYLMVNSLTRCHTLRQTIR